MTIFIYLREKLEAEQIVIHEFEKICLLHFEFENIV